MRLRQLILGFLAVLHLDVCATTFGTDVSDLWFNASEQGWGVNVIHQGDTLFATFFVYGTDTHPKWYVASSVTFVSNNAGTLTYSGDLYETTGPWFGGTFNPNAVGVRKVGATTFVLNTISSGTVTYTVDGVAVSKAITRQTWKVNNLNGTFLGATIGTYSNCPGVTGYLEEPAYFTVTQTTSFISILAVFDNGTCTYSGAYGQDGRMGSISGTVSCSSGITGTFTAFEIEANFQALSGRAQMQSGACQWSGRFGGLRRGS
jgi:hypothetical protein